MLRFNIRLCLREMREGAGRIVEVHHHGKITSNWCYDSTIFLPRQRENTRIPHVKIHRKHTIFQL